MTAREDAGADAARAMANALREAQEAARIEQADRNRAADSTLADRSAAAQVVYSDSRK